MVSITCLAWGWLLGGLLLQSRYIRVPNVEQQLPQPLPHEAILVEVLTEGGVPQRVRQACPQGVSRTQVVREAEVATNDVFQEPRCGLVIDHG